MRGLAIAAWAAGAAGAALGPAQAAARISTERLIRIGVVPRADRIVFVPEGDYGVVDVAGQPHRLKPNETYTAQADSGQLVLGRLRLPGEVRLRPARAWAAIQIGPRRYRGAVILRATPDDGVSAVEELGIEDYLLGVLPFEMDPGWPAEALKAQAVVARTFAYTQLGKYKRAGFDLTDDTRSQVYHGAVEESESVRKAVEQTRGEVLGYKGQILEVYYHACCGGHTADVGAVWPSGQPTPPPLRGVKDRYCRLSPLSHWTTFFRVDDVLAALEKRRLIGGTLRRFDVGHRAGVGGVAKDFVVTVGQETWRVKANELRLALGATQLKSARILHIKLGTKGVEFRGGGSGHGVGLCQWGSRLQAEKGRRYEQILRFYFPGSVLSVIDQ